MSQVVPIKRSDHNTIPIIGAINIKSIVFVQPEAITAANHHFATALQRYHHKSAWDELVGSHKSQVMMFQAIAPISAQKITIGVTIDTSIIHFPIVFATSVHTIKTAIKLNEAAHITAYLGERTLVDTIVAIEFALSCIPFVKSKTNAMAIMIQTKGYDRMKSKIVWIISI